MILPEKRQEYRRNLKANHTSRIAPIGEIHLPVSYFTTGEEGRANLLRSSRTSKNNVAVLTRRASDQEVTYIPTLPGSFFEYFENLTSLRLNCGLTRLPPQIARLEGLRKLDLRNNRLTSLPCQIQRLNLNYLVTDDVVTADMTVHMLTDFVSPATSIPSEQEEQEREETDHAAGVIRLSKHQPLSPSINWLGGPPSLRTIVLRTVLSAVSLAEMDNPEAASSALSYIPTHLRPKLLPPDMCALCGNMIIVDEDEDAVTKPKPFRSDKRLLRRYRTEVIALNQVVLENLFCSRRCLLEMERFWRDRDLEDQLRKLQRMVKFMNI
ncbi:uncharacterized protein V1516DRAFT_671801 [Lipomyces oligophaga]|uniref:uncharacterized protein n=1 Tax=Lipomyces oligophaga TaxID=45792 RepID=UPI0034CEA3A3